MEKRAVSGTLVGLQQVRCCAKTNSANCADAPCRDPEAESASALNRITSKMPAKFSFSINNLLNNSESEIDENNPGSVFIVNACHLLNKALYCIISMPYGNLVLICIQRLWAGNQKTLLMSFSLKCHISVLLLNTDISVQGSGRLHGQRTVVPFWYNDDPFLLFSPFHSPNWLDSDD